MVSAQSIVKNGSDIFLREGRLSQIWKSSMRLRPEELSSGNISLWEMPLPAVIHCTSPSPKRLADGEVGRWREVGR